MDTRESGPALGPYERRVWTVTGRCGVPTGASALALNLTVVAPAAAGFLRLAPGNGLTDSSALNFVPGRTRANLALALLATDGTGSVAVSNGSAGSVHVVLDVTGFFQ